MKGGMADFSGEGGHKFRENIFPFIRKHLALRFAPYTPSAFCAVMLRSSARGGRRHSPEARFFVFKGAAHMSRKQRRILQQKNHPSAAVETNQNLFGGPRTPEGKAISAQNAFSHGLTAACLVLPWENREEFDALLGQLIAEHQPATATEGILVREIAEQYWRLQRARNHEHALLVQTPEILENSASNPALYQGWEKGVALAQRYATRHERAFHKCLATLRTLQKERRLSEKETEAEAAATQAPAATTRPREFVSQNRENACFEGFNACFEGFEETQIAPASFPTVDTALRAGSAC